jgi:alkanesulfonate monooxygenase SsuD/methylene tetrahydromethanopterin reductase-like flavin-dependent oxidoreductase (luciferase family)
VQSLYLDGKREEAYAAIPDELVDATSLVGTEEQVRERIEKYSAIADRLIVSPIQPDPDERRHTMERLAEIAGIGVPA